MKGYIEFTECCFDKCGLELVQAQQLLEPEPSSPHHLPPRGVSTSQNMNLNITV